MPEGTGRIGMLHPHADVHSRHVSHVHALATERPEIDAQWPGSPCRIKLREMVRVYRFMLNLYRYDMIHLLFLQCPVDLPCLQARSQPAFYQHVVRGQSNRHMLRHEQQTLVGAEVEDETRVRAEEDWSIRRNLPQVFLGDLQRS